MADVKEVKPVTDKFKSVWIKQSGLRKNQDKGGWSVVSQMIVRQPMKAGMCLFGVFKLPPNFEAECGAKLSVSREGSLYVTYLCVFLNIRS